MRVVKAQQMMTHFEVPQVICFHPPLQHVCCLAYLLMHQLPMTQLPSYSLPQQRQLQWDLADNAAAVAATAFGTPRRVAAECCCYGVRVLLLLYVWLAEAAAGCYV
jgi:hypothetical protein